MNLLIIKQAEQINELLKSFQNDEDRMEFIEKTTEGICVYCGAISDRCHCQNDE